MRLKKILIEINKFLIVFISILNSFALNPDYSFAVMIGKKTHCLVVALKKEEDWNDAFAGDSLLHDPSFLGDKCTIFPNWDELNNYYNASLKSLDPNENQIFIYQAAHGSPGGSCQTSFQVNSPDTILSTMRHIAERHQIASHLNSCYSGDLLRKKHETDPFVSLSQVANLCIATASVEDHVGFGSLFSRFSSEDLLGKSMTDLFKELPEGLLSGAVFRSTAPKSTLEIVTEITELLTEVRTSASIPSELRACGYHPDRSACISGTSCSSTGAVKRSLSIPDELIRRGLDKARRAACENFSFTVNPRTSLRQLAFLYQLKKHEFTPEFTKELLADDPSLLHTLLENQTHKDDFRMYPIEELMDVVSDLNAKNKKGESYLELAIRSGNIRYVRKLLEKGANPNLSDSEGTSLINLARHLGHTDIVEALQSDPIPIRVPARRAASFHPDEVD